MGVVKVEKGAKEKKEEKKEITPELANTMKDLVSYSLLAGLLLGLSMPLFLLGLRIPSAAVITMGLVSAFVGVLILGYLNRLVTRFWIQLGFKVPERPRRGRRGQAKR